MAITTPTKDRWITCAEVAAMLGVTPRTIWRLAAAGRIPKPLRIGPKSPRWKESALTDYLDRLSEGGAR